MADTPLRYYTGAYPDGNGVNPTDLGGLIPSAVSDYVTGEVINAGPIFVVRLNIVSLPVTVAAPGTDTVGFGSSILYTFPKGKLLVGCSGSLALGVTDQDDYTNGTPEGTYGIGTTAASDATISLADEDIVTEDDYTMASYAATLSPLTGVGNNAIGTSSTTSSAYLNILVDAADIDDDASDDMLVTGSLILPFIIADRA